MQEVWLPCKIHVKAHGGKPTRVYVVLHDSSGWLVPRTSVVLLIRHPSGVVFQVSGKVSRRRGRNYAEIYVPIEAGLALAAQMGIKAEKSVTIYGYTAQIRNVKPPTP